MARAVRTDTEAGDQRGQEIRTLEERMGSVRLGLAGSLRELLSQANSNVGPLTGLSQGRDMIRCLLSNHVASQPGGEWAGGEQVGAGLGSRGRRGVAWPSWRQQGSEDRMGPRPIWEAELQDSTVGWMCG